MPFLAAKEHRGFSLIELLVVIAVIGLLAALLLPVLNRSTLRAQGVGCLNNTRQILLAWHFYAADNEDVLPPNEDNSKAGNWVSGAMNFQPTNVANYSVQF